MFHPGIVNPHTNALIAALQAANRKPRTRQEWEDRFSHWQKPASDSEEARIEATERKIVRALSRSDFLPTRRWRIVRQGSNHNNTNTRVDSDIDLCVCLDDAIFLDGPSDDMPTIGEFGYTPLPFTFFQYKEHLAACLSAEFGNGAVEAGKKSIHIRKNDDDKISADVVPAFRLERYGHRLIILRDGPTVGVGFHASDGRLVTNFPEQHYTNGCAKNDRVRRRYKRVVRIVKRLRNHMAQNPQVAPNVQARAKATASFLIESLVYNCPDSVFDHASVYEDVVAVLRHLSNSFAFAAYSLFPPQIFWTEVNGVKKLFEAGQAWTEADASEFVAFARAYMEV